ncbi:type VI secretion system protein ImpB [Silvibacterium bohemicum]|uniref:Type VI secretion system protein ImpB n=1 Tax=Silvibacterium bohemicum TaxID=1577686 RepID=A0A841JV49_9BACT|nr:type VI secretion system contractile sheath small subunit [Silvibacterium bohemicum]MBB6143619.1 type VI secretion system protein ImpB [Silvibacterium bohemicum]
MAESIQHKLDRVRPPRVQITYDVQIGDAFEVKELPLVVGVLADLSGQLPDGTTPPKLRDRQFVEIDRDSFKEIFAKINPRSAFTVDNLMKVRAADATETPRLPIEISAEANPKLDNSKPLDALLGNVLGDDPLYMFHPLWVIRHTPQLNTLYEARSRLSDLLSKLDGNDKLEAELKVAATDANKPKDMVLDASSYPEPKDTKQLSAPDAPAK